MVSQDLRGLRFLLRPLPFRNDPILKSFSRKDQKSREIQGAGRILIFPSPSLFHFLQAKRSLVWQGDSWKAHGLVLKSHFKMR